MGEEVVDDDSAPNSVHEEFDDIFAGRVVHRFPIAVLREDVV